MSLPSFLQVACSRSLPSRFGGTSSQVKASWSEYFLPFPPTSISDIAWLPRHLLLVFSNPPGFGPGSPASARHLLSALAALVFVAGCASFYSRDWTKLALLQLPFAAALAASALHAYPFAGRLLLFTVPVLALTLAEGTWRLTGVAGRGGFVMFAALVAALFVGSVTSAARHPAHPRAIEEIKPVMAYVRDHKLPSHHVFLHYSSQYAFKYYAPRYGFSALLKDQPRLARDDGANETENFEPALRPRPPELVIGSSSPDSRRALGRDVDSIRGNGRTWVFFSHVRESVVASYLNHLDRIGRRIDCFKAKGASACLYQFG